MQLFALDLKKNLLSARRAQRKIDYFCLECNQIVRLRGGPYRQPHFYHLDPTPFCRQNQKGLIHLQLQNYFYQTLPKGDCQLEYRIPEVNRIADVVWISKKIIFEIQYSPISGEEVIKRNHDYGKCGWKVVWILHDHRFNRYRLSSAEKALRTSPHYFTNMDQLGKGMIYDQYDHIEKGIRKIRFAPLPVVPLQITEISPECKNCPLPDFLVKRVQFWSMVCEGDLLFLFQNHPGTEYLKKALEVEQSLYSHMKKNFFRDLILFFWVSLFKTYDSVFRTLLEKSCR